MAKNTAVAQKIRQVVKETGMTQQNFAKKIGLGESVISRWLKGDRQPSITSLKKISEATGKPLKYFLESSENDSSPDEKDIKILQLEKEILELKLKIRELKTTEN